jgi:hypothetical protein
VIAIECLFCFRRELCSFHAIASPTVAPTSRVFSLLRPTAQIHIDHTTGFRAFRAAIGVCTRSMCFTRIDLFADPGVEARLHALQEQNARFGSHRARR